MSSPTRPDGNPAIRRESATAARPGPAVHPDRASAWAAVTALLTRRGITSAALATALLAGTVPVFASPAAAAVTPVAGPHSIEVFASVDMVGAVGFSDAFVVQVWRNGVQVGTSGDPVRSDLFELNHAGPPCWVGSTPDIIAGDQVRVITDASDPDDPVGEFTTVADLDADPPRLVALDDDGEANDLVMTGRARNLEGTGPLPVDRLAAEIVQPAFRDAGDVNWDRRAIGAAPGVAMPDGDTVFGQRDSGVLAYDPAGPGNPDGTRWTATWKNLPGSIGPLALDGEHTIASWDGVDAAGEPVGMTIVDAEDLSGPSAGCPAASADAVTTTTPKQVNLAARNAGGDLVISGISHNAAEVEVTVDDSDATHADALTVEADISRPATLATTDAPVPARSQTWTARVPMSALTDGDLADGELTIAGSYDRVVESRVETRDERQIGTRTESAPRFAEDGTAVLVPALDEQGAPLPADDAAVYRDAAGQPVQATDAEGNPSVTADGTPIWTRQDTVLTEVPVLEEFTVVEYRHAAGTIGGRRHTIVKDLVAPEPPTVFPAGGTYYGSPEVTVSAADPAQETVRYAVGGTTAAEPGAASPAVPTPYRVSQSQQLKLAAYDRAGNRSSTVTETYDVRRAGAPGAPTRVTGVPGNATATLSWTAPADNGGHPVTAYQVRAYDGTGTAVRTLEAAGPGLVFGGLTNGRTYTFDVRAVNALGPGAASARSAPVALRERTAPRVGAFTPAANSTAVAQGGNVTVTFTEPVTGVDGATMRLYRSGVATPISTRVSYNPATRVATLNPYGYSASLLAADARYTVVLSGGIVDLAGNPLARTSWSFTTGPRPTVTGRSPGANATKVKRAATIAVRFGEAVTGLSSATVTVTRVSTGGRVTGTLSYDSRTRTVTFNPYGRSSSKLRAKTKYRVSLGSGIRDRAGNPLTATSWTFTTGTS